MTWFVHNIHITGTNVWRDLIFIVKYLIIVPNIMKDGK